MALPGIPSPAPGEIRWICACYEDGEARWGGQFDAVADWGSVNLAALSHFRW